MTCISIHAPREGSDPRRYNSRQNQRISIHAPREGSDADPFIRGYTGSHFYPRSPRGERRSTDQIPGLVSQFLSTLPARGATQTGRIIVARPYHFYPRSPRGERRWRAKKSRLSTAFLSTLPARGATTMPAIQDPRTAKISIHAPREGSDYRKPGH